MNERTYNSFIMVLQTALSTFFQEANIPYSHQMVSIIYLSFIDNFSYLLLLLPPC